MSPRRPSRSPAVTTHGAHPRPVRAVRSAQASPAPPPALGDGLRFRRAPHVLCYWHDDQLIVENYARREKTEAAPLVLEVLDGLATWQSRDALQARLTRIPTGLLNDLLDALVAHGLVDRSDAPTEADALQTWAAWTPAATYFHLATKDVAFTPREETIRRLRQRVAETPPPAALKTSNAQVRVPLPAVRRRGALPKALVERRTWRRFGTRPLAIEELSTLLGLTWGVQDWMHVAGWGRMPLKTAPSGGARHAIEAYVLVRRVQGLQPGLYHYQPAAHELHLLRPKASAADIRRYLPEQAWYGAASALVLMTAVFPRVQWRYPFARAYRTVLAEVGHHCQTFCLVATWLDLAPFCTMALADTRIERDLQIDGVTESVLYAAGVGPRPAGVAWAPWPDTTATPRRAANRPQRERQARPRRRGELA